MDDLPIVLKLRQLGAVQVLAEPPELRLHVVKIDDTDRRLLGSNQAQRLEPVPAGDEDVLAVAHDACQRGLQANRADRLRELANDGGVVGADRVAEVDLVNRNEGMLGGADEGVHFSGFLSMGQCRPREGVDRPLLGIGVGIRGVRGGELLRQQASSQVHRVSGWVAKHNPTIADAE